ncbi:MAG: hypothetical protein H7Y59_07280 [Anaerolineales bacterium]|nr:hypothetical protein [Anaerolineales bacterium]
MTTETIFNIIPSLIAALAFIWGVFSYRNQMHAQLFMEFTKRFEEVMQSFPKNAWSARFDIDGKSPAKSKELSLSVLRYLNLSSEEYYLQKNRWLPKEVWKIWEGELIRTLRSPLFIREWEKLSKEFETYPEFTKYVNDKQKNVK